MILPIGDSPNPRFLPWVSWLLIAVNVGVFVLLWPQMGQGVDPGDPRLVDYLHAIATTRGVGLAELRQLAGQLSAYDLVVFEHGFRPAVPTLHDALASMFLHGGFAHLAGNMLFLWIFGDNVEHRLGHLGFAVFYILGGVAACGGDALLRWGDGVPSVGASGAISAVLGAYFVWFPGNVVRLFVFLFPFFMDTVAIGARWVLGFYVLVQNLLPALFSRGGGVSYGAHLGGFAAGALFAWWVASSLLSSRPGALHPTPTDAPARIDALNHALVEGADARAARLWLSMPAQTPGLALDATAALRLARTLEQRGDESLALAVALRALATFPGVVDAAALHLIATRLLLASGRTTEAWPHLQRAAELGLSPVQLAEAQRLHGILLARSRRAPAGPW